MLENLYYNNQWANEDHFLFYVLSNVKIDILNHQQLSRNNLRPTEQTNWLLSHQEVDQSFKDMQTHVSLTQQILDNLAKDDLYNLFCLVSSQYGQEYSAERIWNKHPLFLQGKRRFKQITTINKSVFFVDRFQEIPLLESELQWLFHAKNKEDYIVAFLSLLLQRMLNFGATLEDIKKVFNEKYRELLFSNKEYFLKILITAKFNKAIKKIKNHIENKLTDYCDTEIWIKLSIKDNALLLFNDYIEDNFHNIIRCVAETKFDNNLNQCLDSSLLKEINKIILKTFDHEDLMLDNLQIRISTGHDQCELNSSY